MNVYSLGPIIDADIVYYDALSGLHGMDSYLISETILRDVKTRLTNDRMDILASKYTEAIDTIDHMLDRRQWEDRELVETQEYFRQERAQKRQANT